MRHGTAASQAGLLAKITRLGTNLLTVTDGQTLTGQTAKLPDAAPAMISRLPGVTSVQDTGTVSSADAYRSPLIPPVDPGALTEDAARLGLRAAAGTSVARGNWLDVATACQPVAVLGATAAQRLGIDRIWPGERIRVGGQWFYVAAILKLAVLPEIGSSVLVGYPAMENYVGFDSHAYAIYLRAATSRVQAVGNLLAAQANPETPSQVNVFQPSAALTAQGAFGTLFLGIGAVALLSGAVGVANIMGFRHLTPPRDRTAPRSGRHQRPPPHPVPGRRHAARPDDGGDGAALGAGRHRRLRPRRRLGRHHPCPGLGRRARPAVLIGANAGLLPALRAARLSPTEALWTL